MAQRPVFVADQSGHVIEQMIDFKWYPGMAASQKRKSVESLHISARSLGLEPVLEVSTKSESQLGQSLSALKLKVSIPGLGKLFVECAFQGSKVFEHRGPFTDLYESDPIAAKRDPRLRESGLLREFNLNGDIWPLAPKTAFYDWLYIQALLQNNDLSSKLENYAGFTDIEFNPKKSYSSQARSCALFIALERTQRLESSTQDQQSFIQAIRHVYDENTMSEDGKLPLLMPDKPTKMNVSQNGRTASW